MAVVKGGPDADPAAGGLVLHRHEPQLDLGLGRVVRVAGISRSEDSSRVIATRHEHLGGVVDIGELKKFEPSGASPVPW